MTITLDQARQLIAAARDAGRTNGFKPLTVVVLDAGGHMIAAEREDGASTRRVDVAHGKAHGAIAMGMGSRALMARAEQQPTFVAALTAAFGGALIPVPGGVLLLDDTGTTVGAIGVTGDTSDNDELCAVAAARAVGLTPNTG